MNRIETEQTFYLINNAVSMLYKWHNIYIIKANRLILFSKIFYV